uniref:MENTAL domain-containing protein n=1 Tax=Maylandia zebra TaxID=106582 RepID=A0A3P9B5J3_9CICH
MHQSKHSAPGTRHPAENTSHKSGSQSLHKKPFFVMYIVIRMRNVLHEDMRFGSSHSPNPKCLFESYNFSCFCVVLKLVIIILDAVCVCQVNGGIQNRLEQEVLHYDYHLLAVFRFAVLILAYAVCKLRHWWAIAITTAVSCAFLIAKVILSKLLSLGAFGYLLPIISFVLAWIETWLLDFKVLPQEIEDENRHQSIIDTSRAPLLGPGPLSDGQFYSPPESLADSDEELDDKHEPEKGLITQMT